MYINSNTNGNTNSLLRISFKIANRNSICKWEK